MPRDFGQLLPLLQELTIERQRSIDDPGCRDFLAKIKPTGKAGKTARALLELSAADFATSGHPILMEALTQRIEAAQRLMGKLMGMK